MLRDQVGRLVIVKEMQTIGAAFREASSRKSAAPPARVRVNGDQGWVEPLDQQLSCGTS